MPKLRLVSNVGKHNIYFIIHEDLKYNSCVLHSLIDQLTCNWLGKQPYYRPNPYMSCKLMTLESFVLKEWPLRITQVYIVSRRSLLGVLLSFHFVNFTQKREETHLFSWLMVYFHSQYFTKYFALRHFLLIPLVWLTPVILQRCGIIKFEPILQVTGT